MYSINCVTVLYLATAHVCLLLLCKMIYCDVTSFYCMQYIVCVPVDVLFLESLSFLGEVYYYMVSGVVVKQRLWLFS